MANPMTLDDIMHAHAAIAHDAAAQGELIARTTPNYDSYADYQKIGTTALMTAKLTLLSLVHAGLITDEQLNKVDLRSIIKSITSEALNG